MTQTRGGATYKGKENMRAGDAWLAANGVGTAGGAAPPPPPQQPLPPDPNDLTATNALAAADEPDVPTDDDVVIKADTATIRAWAQANGYDVSNAGPIPADIRDAYAAAHS